MNTVITLKNIEFTVNLKEVLRYMGAAGSNDSATRSLAERAVSQVKSACRPAACYIKTELKISGDMLDFGITSVKSSDLAKNLRGCREAFLFAATVGADFDRLINRSLIISPAEALALDAVGSAVIEDICDSVNNTLVALADKPLKPRFSPGYGDLDISFQKELVFLLDTHRKIGLSLTEGLMMIPTKSVTAIIGVPD